MKIFKQIIKGNLNFGIYICFSECFSIVVAYKQSAEVVTLGFHESSLPQQLAHLF